MTRPLLYALAALAAVYVALRGAVWVQDRKTLAALDDITGGM